MRKLLCAMMLLLFIGGCFSRPMRTPAAIDPAIPHVSVMTFNVNFGLAGDAATLAAVAQQDADIVFLQETTPHWETVLRMQCGSDYLHIQFKHPDVVGGGGAGGLGVMSKLPIEQIDYLPATDWFPAARVVLTSPIGRLQVLNVHLRPPISDRGSAVSGYFTTPPVRQAEISTFAAALDKNLPTLIVGDFNENERGRAFQWLTANGFKSALPEFQPEAQTWRWRTSYIALSGRYDHLCYDAKLTPLRVEVRNAGRSDHLPVVGVFALAETPPPSGDTR
jgi:endonuclease/exonuclease/phosphatase (EEP) superfamily protein YafD